MANHISTILLFSGDEQKVRAAILSILNEHGNVDFNKLIRMPKPYLHNNKWHDFRCENWGTKWNSFNNENVIKAELQSEIIDDETYRRWHLTHNHSSEFDPFSLGFTPLSYRGYVKRINKKRFKKIVEQCDKENTHIDQLYFETAWSLAEPILLTLSEKHPDVTIEVQYADEDLGYNCGYLVLSNGQYLTEVRREADCSNEEQRAWEDYADMITMGAWAEVSDIY